MSKTDWNRKGERGVSRGQRLDMTMLALLRLKYPASKNQIVRDMGLRNTPYMNDILEQLIRDGFVMVLEERHGRRVDRIYSLTGEGERKAEIVRDAYMYTSSDD